MNALHSIRKAEFEWRIFISLGIVAVTVIAAVTLFPGHRTLFEHIAAGAGIPADGAAGTGYIAAAVLMLLLSLLRISAGSMLTPGRVMSFRIKTDALMTEGPYRLCRNPIYLADFGAMCTFALFFPPIGLLMPALFLVHYGQIIRYEEVSLASQFGLSYREFQSGTPRLLPSPRSFLQLPHAMCESRVTATGVRHNALYLLFIPGFLVAALTDSFLTAVLIGLPGVIDWAIVHTVIGRERKERKFGGRQAEDSPRRGRKERKSEDGVFSSVLYAQCWEDPRIDRAAFVTCDRKRVFTITSGGDNALAFLLDNPVSVTALDFNRHQNDLLELKIAAMRELHHPDLLAFCGVIPCSSRLEMYDRMRKWLSPEAAAFWDDHRLDIHRGIIHAGRFESYMRLIRRGLYLCVGRRHLRALFTAETRDARAAIVRRLDTLRWRFVTRVLLSRRTMSLLFSSAFFRFLEEDFSFGRYFGDLAHRAFVDLPVGESSFLAYILLGNYRLEALPLWLRPEHYETIRARLGRIRTVTGRCEEYFATLEDGSIDRFNFSNIFEWMPPEACRELLEEAVRVGSDGAVLTYRNLLVPRSRPEELASVIDSNLEVSALLRARDLSFIYRSFVVEWVNKQRTVWPSASISYQTAAI